MLAGASLLSMVITPESFMMIQLQEHCEKCVSQMDEPTDRRINRQMDRRVLRANWSQAAKNSQLAPTCGPVFTKVLGFESDF